MSSELNSLASSSAGGGGQSSVSKGAAGAQRRTLAHCRLMDTMLPVLALLCLGLSGVLGQFPKACVTDEALNERRCCPVQTDGSMCGATSGRGRCKVTRVRNTFRKNYTEDHDDDRLDWPNKYYDSMCACNENYGGFDCGDCKIGYYGEKCEEQKILERKEIRELSRQERLKFFSYLSLAKIKLSARYSVLMTGNRHDRKTFRFVDASVYNVFAWIHYYSFQPLLKDNDFDFSISFAHEAPNFLTWHRWYLAFLEREIQRLSNDYSFALPYYDWSRDGKNCTICNDAFMGKSDSQGVLTSSSYFGSWTSMCSGFSYYDKYCPVADDVCRMEPVHRNPGADPNNKELPSEKQVADVLQWKDYDTFPFNISARRSFRNCLEGFIDPTNGTRPRRSLHNLFHMFMGGTMAQVPLSSNDPIFMLHHAFIDKVFERWIQKYNKTTTDYPNNHIFGHAPDDHMVPSMPPVKNKDYLKRAAFFGYKYSDYTPPLPKAD